MHRFSTFLSGLYFLTFPVLSFAHINYPCSGAPGIYRVNPDQTLGGFVAKTAIVDATVIIGQEASVCDRATLLEGAQLQDKSIVSGRATVPGDLGAFSYTFENGQHNMLFGACTYPSSGCNTAGACL